MDGWNTEMDGEKGVAAASDSLQVWVAGEAINNGRNMVMQVRKTGNMR